MDIREGDILLVTKLGTGVVPATPDGEVYGGVVIELDEDRNPHHKDKGDLFTIQITQANESNIMGEWYTEEYPSHDVVHLDWMEVLKRRGELDINPLSHLSKDFDPEEIETTTETQEENQVTETKSRDTWTDKKSELMSNIN